MAFSGSEIGQRVVTNWCLSLKHLQRVSRALLLTWISPTRIFSLFDPGDIGSEKQSLQEKSDSL